MAEAAVAAAAGLLEQGQGAALAAACAPHGVAPSPRQPLSGWLLKRKSHGAKTRLLCNANRRYFTLDFESRVLYYSHSEGSKSVSLPISFREMLSVQPLVAAAPQEQSGPEEQQEASAAPEVQRSNSKGSITSSLRRIPKIPSFGGLAKRPVEQHGFVLRSPGKVMELLCASRAEAETWVASLQEAMDLVSRNGIGHEGGKAEPSTAPGSSTRTTPTPRDDLDEDSIDELDTEEVAPMSQAFPTTTEPRVSARASEGFAVREAFPTTMEPRVSARASEAAAGDGEDRGPRRAFGLLPPRAPKSARSQAAADEAPRQAAEAGRCTASEEVTVMSGVDPLRLDAGGAWSAGVQVEDSGSTRAASSRYADKAEGLTLQQRLSQLDFSDDEDEDAAPPPPAAAAGAPGPARATQPELVTAHGPAGAAVTEDACETFVQEPDSDDD